ncbi:hypothetical protein HLB23_22265 [Nocardia uniformis]|uniref:Uncharacterized protein n=1 Tax=Nocardia uniformis TaxID=53432 RepID=A0A849C857_9NOCA|nr:hypothetical protein [Nocardia uniformis]NNH72550.1 hypothetical protein [Nocardia uniformis]
MLEVPTALGYLRSDISGIRQPWDDTHIRSLARRLGYTFAKTVVFGAHTDHPLQRLVNVAKATDVDAVVVPSLEHFGGELPDELVAVADVITVSPEQTFARWISRPMQPPMRVGDGHAEG